ncbi:PREDICTED: F-box protein SKIP31-like isoform X2 [Nelumbo nucifera]|uniref:F-box protein SKIP31-like isoform X2 n=1 Tax=Nelumbo nucifera TaxID=4432 RepID=A0A1U8B6M5_NELNU|nr:PREDICTED: F-box protein SKIP31-like isoform X2 [Nelumbo nucifera]
MTASDDENESLAHFLESEVLSEVSDEEEKKTEPLAKRLRLDNEGTSQTGRGSSQISRRIETGIFSKIPPELFHNILKFLSSEDLVACSLVCRFLNHAASDESLWRRLYCMRWGLSPPTKKLRQFAWKKLYIQVNDDRIIMDKTVADQVSMWRSSKGMTDEVVVDHACSGETCSYYQIGDVFICEKTGRVHVCDDTCREVVLDASSGLLVCTISGHCFDRMLSPSEMEPDAEQQQGGVTDEAEPFMGSGRFARAYLLGYNCADEKELEAALRFC